MTEGSSVPADAVPLDVHAGLAPTRERLLSGHQQEEDEQLVLSLRPKRLDECIGQRALIERLRIAITAARQRGEALDHVLFHGPPGLGKTTLAHIIAREMGSEISTTTGPTLERPGDLMGLLTNQQEGDVLFVDEIHRTPRAVEEFLYSAMEDFYVNFSLDKGAYVKPLKFSLPRFTLVGATTRAGALTAPLRERFGIQLHFDFYADEELAQIVTRSAEILGVEVEPDGASEIARRSRGTPRIANRLLNRVRDYAEVRADGRITQGVADDALRLEGVDGQGLDKLDRSFLGTIIGTYDGGPVGIEALGATLNEDSDTLVDMVEPFLLKIGFLARTQSGRRATKRAYEHLGVAFGAHEEKQLGLPM